MTVRDSAELENAMANKLGNGLILKPIRPWSVEGGWTNTFELAARAFSRDIQDLNPRNKMTTELRQDYGWAFSTLEEAIRRVARR